jgi:hypothetical protein
MSNLDEFSKIDIELNKQSIINSTDDINSSIVKSNYLNKFCNTFFIFIILLIVCSLILGSIVYVVFAIISLCETSYIEQKNMCKQSNMWLYILINLIISSVNTTSFVNKRYSDEKQTPILNILILFGLLSWGCYELFGVECVNNLHSTLLYIILEINVIVEIIINGIVIITLCTSYFILE